jgi:environmental stress-induced protein Ves
VRIVRFDALRPVPWKNGGGTTVEMVAHPPGATLDAFEWRVSAAEIHRDGPFSRFDGVDRTLAILDGEGLVLDFGDRIARVGPEDTPFLFHGESPASARPLGGFVRDLNVMTRRAAWRATMVRHTLTPETTLPAEGETRVLVALDACVIACGTQRAALAPRDALVLDGREPSVTLDQPSPARVVAIAFHGEDRAK